MKSVNNHLKQSVNNHGLDIKPLPYTGSPLLKMLFVPIIEPYHGFYLSEYRRITDPFGTIRLL